MTACARANPRSLTGKYFGRRTISEQITEAATQPPRRFAGQASSTESGISFRKPVAADGPAITALIAASPPLDGNSAYCNLLQCSHFADFCVIAQDGGEIVGWVSAYRPPSEPDSLFVWQIAVARKARGQKLAQRMMDALLERPAVRGVREMITTITADNRASWALFEGVARRLGAGLQKTEHFSRDVHFGGNHATEWLARIGPLPAATNP